MSPPSYLATLWVKLLCMLLHNSARCPSMAIMDVFSFRHNGGQAPQRVGTRHWVGSRQVLVVTLYGANDSNCVGSRNSTKPTTGKHVGCIRSIGFNFEGKFLYPRFIDRAGTMETSFTVLADYLSGGTAGCLAGIRATPLAINEPSRSRIDRAGMGIGRRRGAALVSPAKVMPAKASTGAPPCGSSISSR